MVPQKTQKGVKTPFDKKKLDFFKKLLLDMKEGLLKDVKNMASDKDAEMGDSKDVSGHVLHMADVATDMYDKEFNMNLASKERELLQKIEGALKRIDEGTYGVCLATGKPISLERLKAIPYAEYCLKYQEEMEKDAPRRTLHE